MFLTFPKEWRFRPPKGVTWNTESIPQSVQDEFLRLIRMTSAHGEPKSIFEKYKRYFCLCNGNPYSPSSSLSWAENDLLTQMNEASKNPPLFIEAFYNASRSIHEESEGSFYPEIKEINRILQDNKIGYLIDLPNLLLIEKESVQVKVEEPAQSLKSKGIEILQKSLSRSDELLNEGHGREAVQECLWLLESISTAFQGLDTESGTMNGKYFNEIMKELKKINSGTTFKTIISWLIAMHGYLSSPSGGGVRHGLNLNRGIELSDNDARLFCNLIRSYLSYLIIEYEKLSSR
jgi:hypothetical protein